MSARPSVHEYFAAMSVLVSARATCSRRKVGCVLVNSKNHVLATGYNGPASGLPHCIDNPCAGAKLKSGSGLDVCEALHAEQNALLQCSNPWEIDRVYCTTEPCSTCTKMLLNTSARQIIFIDEYPSEGRKIWANSGRTPMVCIDELAREESNLIMSLRELV